MTEADWQAAKDPDAMLRLVAGRLSPRRWHLLACAVARRAGELLPDGPLQDAVEWAERHAGAAAGRGDTDDLLRTLPPVTRAAAEAAGQAQRAVVRAADPDSDPDAYQHTAARKTNPAAPLFQAAGRHAAGSVGQAREAVGHAAEAVEALLAVRPGPAQLDAVREAVAAAVRVRAAANLAASYALKLKGIGDDVADRDNGRNVHHRYSAAQDAVRREEEYAGYRLGDLNAPKARADRKALGRALRDLVGDPFREYRFDPRWRTDTVVGLARAIDAGRAFADLPILADALLDADCDDEAVLRHCRGTEPHADPSHHVRGCWVLDLILDREPALFDAPPIPTPHPARASRRR